MTYINPIEILRLNDYPLQDIDSAVVKKAKRRLQAEIELSDNGHLELNGQHLTKTNAEQAIDELENEERKEYYYFLAKNTALNNFLKTGGEQFFSQFRHESIYQVQAFVQLVSPFFCYQYDKALTRAFNANDEARFRRILAVTPLVTLHDRDHAYKTVYGLLKERIKELEQLIFEIKNEESDYDETNIDQVLSWVKRQFNVTMVNALPATFQSTRNNVAQTIRNLSVNIFNAFGRAQLALNIIDYSLHFDIDGIKRQTFTDDRQQINEINERHKRDERNAAILKKYAAVVIGIRNKLTEIDNGNTTAYSVNQWLSSNISITEINGLPSELSEIRNQIAIGLKATSVAVWNKFNDVTIALNAINFAFGINTTTENRAIIIEAKNKLEEIKRKIDANKPTSTVKTQSTATARPPVRTMPAKPVATESSNEIEENQGLMVFLAIVGLIVLIVIIANSNKSSDNYNSSYSSPSTSSTTATYNTTEPSYPSTTETTPSTTDTAAYSSPVTGTDTSASYSSPNSFAAPVETESPFKGNQLANGASPLNGCFGKGRYAGDAWIEFINSNTSDAVVCLVDVYTERTIRNEYIQAGSTFKMSRIPTGTYYLKVYYGNDWNPTKQNFCGTTGAFESDVHFSKSSNFSDRIEVNNSDYSYTTGTITLYTVSNGNMSSEATSEADFFKQ